jgi:hypothetical protein
MSSGQDSVDLMRPLWNIARASTSAGDTESTAPRHVARRLEEGV